MHVQLFLEAMPIILRLFPKARGHLLFSNYSWNNLPKPSLAAMWMQDTWLDLLLDHGI